MKYQDGMYELPEMFGLEPVALLVWTSTPYEYDVTMIWTDGDVFYVASDEGTGSLPFSSDFWTAGDRDLAEFPTRQALAQAFAASRGQVRTPRELSVFDANYAVLLDALDR